MRRSPASAGRPSNRRSAGRRADAAARPKDARCRNVRLAQAVEGVISLVSANPELFREAESRLGEEDPEEEALIHIWKAVRQSLSAGIPVNPDLLGDLLSQDERRLLSGILMKTPEGPPKDLLEDYLAVVELENAKARARGGSAADLTALLKLKKEQNRT